MGNSHFSIFLENMIYGQKNRAIRTSLIGTFSPTLRLWKISDRRSQQLLWWQDPYLSDTRWMMWTHCSEAEGLPAVACRCSWHLDSLTVGVTVGHCQQSQLLDRRPVTSKWSKTSTRSQKYRNVHKSCSSGVSVTTQWWNMRNEHLKT